MSNIHKGYKAVRPILSTDARQARLQVFGLYRTFYRYIPYIAKYYDIPYSHNDIKMKIREYFYKNANIRDLRVIDTLIIKGYMEFKEIDHQWQSKGHVMAHFKPTIEPRPKDFICKFMDSNDP